MFAKLIDFILQGLEPKIILGQLESLFTSFDTSEDGSLNREACDVLDAHDTKPDRLVTGASNGAGRRVQVR